MSYIEISDEDYGFVDAKALAEKGRDLHGQYVGAQPYPHIAIDDFVSPCVLEACLEDFPREPDPESLTFERAQERYKTSYNPDYLSPRVRSFFYSLNSRPFIRFLENMTGIKGLIPDPYFLGGGFHETKQGGHLDVHADFNLHPGMKVERRLNLLIYLNKDWRPEYGGSLEIWDTQMKQCVESITPEFGRCVVFSTDATSFHGHPAPIAHPEGSSRRSIALYYYTATWDGAKRKFTTQFKARPKSIDKVDWKVRRSELMEDLLPPILTRNIRRVTRKLKQILN